MNVRLLQIFKNGILETNYANVFLNKSLKQYKEVEMNKGSFKVYLALTLAEVW